MKIHTVHKWGRPKSNLTMPGRLLLSPPSSSSLALLIILKPPPVSVSYFQSGGFIPLSASVGMTVYWLQCCGSVRLTVRLTYLRAISLTLKHVGRSKWWCWKGCGSPLTAIDSWGKTISFTAEIKRMYYDVWRSCSAVLWLTCQVSDADSADWIPC